MRIENNKVQKKLRIYIAGFFALFLLPLTALSARKSIEMQQDQQGASSGAARTGVVFATDENYRIGANDVIEIQIVKWNEVSGTYAVNADGTIDMKFIKSLRVQGKTVNELATEIADLIRGSYVKDPQVTVSIKQYNSRTFFVQGAVKSPGMYVVVGKPTLMTLLNLAGGLQVEHGSTAFIIRKVSVGESAKLSNEEEPSSEEVAIKDQKEQYEVLKSNIERLYQGDFNQNLVIEPGDTVHIPPADLYFLAGEINKPGSFQLRQGLTLRQAITQAGGVTNKAKSSNTFILRQDGAGGEPVKLEVNLSEIMKAERADVLLLPNDYIFIPGSKLKSFSNVLLNGFGMNFVRVPWVN